MTHSIVIFVLLPSPDHCMLPCLGLVPPSSPFVTSIGSVSHCSQCDHQPGHHTPQHGGLITYFNYSSDGSAPSLLSCQPGPAVQIKWGQLYNVADVLYQVSRWRYTFNWYVIYIYSWRSITAGTTQLLAPVMTSSFTPPLRSRAHQFWCQSFRKP